jgi:large subunit ribosomal protein L31|tara:strand:- start:1415 stop:1702 length:288 start_codon:yes stop_codon:yes gene_type:complete
MKKNIHPDYHEIDVVMTDGTKFKTKSTWGKKGDVLNLDIDPKSHPAWSGGEKKLVDTQGQISKFAKRFKNYKKSKEKKVEVNKVQTKPKIKKDKK